MTQCADCDAVVEVEVADRAKRDAADALDSRLRSSGLPFQYRSGERTVETLPPSIAPLIGLSSRLGDGVTGLYLYGKAGSYKTSLAAATMAHAVRSGKTGRYVLVPDLLADIHASYANNSDETRARLEDNCISPACLVLDDLGKEKASEHAAGVLFNILDGRYRTPRKGSWLIVTSNYSLDALCKRFGDDELSDPIQRRLTEMLIQVEMQPVVNDGGKSWRMSISDAIKSLAEWRKA